MMAMWLLRSQTVFQAILLYVFMSILCSVATIKAKSFYDIPIEYTLVPENQSMPLSFSIERRSGALRPMPTRLSYLTDRRVYRMVVTATEPASGFSSTATVCIYKHIKTGVCSSLGSLAWNLNWISTVTESRRSIKAHSIIYPYRPRPNREIKLSRMNLLQRGAPFKGGRGQS